MGETYLGWTVSGVQFAKQILHESFQLIIFFTYGVHNVTVASVKSCRAHQRFRFQMANTKIWNKFQLLQYDYSIGSIPEKILKRMLLIS